MIEAIDQLDEQSEDLDGDLITDEELADAVAADMGSDDPVVRRLWDDLIRGEHARAVMAEAETRRVIEFNQRLQGQHRFQDGLGQLVARIPMSVYLHWTAIHGHEFWDQPDSLDFLAKRAGGGRGNPGLLIETKARPTVIVDQAFAGVAAQQSSARGAEGHERKAAAGAGEAPPAAHSGPRGRRGRWAS